MVRRGRATGLSLGDDGFRVGSVSLTSSRWRRCFTGERRIYGFIDVVNSRHEM